MNKKAIVGKMALLLSFIFAALTSGCEDKIQIDLKNTEPRLVIEGRLAYPYGADFRLSRTTDFYQPTRVELVSGALIVISDSRDQVDTLHENKNHPGLYFGSKIHCDFLETYVATVKVNGNTYEASTTMPLPTNIDSVRTSFQEGGGLGPEEDRGYRIHVYFRDRPGVSDYARIMVWRNGAFDSDYYLYDGKYSDGNVIDYDYFFNVYQIGDRVDITLVSIDEKMYDYFVTLSEVVVDDNGGSAFDATPANPNTNWSGGALGYFGAFYGSQKRLTVKE